MCKIHEENKTKKELEVKVLEECGSIVDGKKTYKVQYVSFNGGTPQYSIREYYTDKEGNLKPGKNGIHMSGNVLKQLIEMFGD